MDYLNPGMRKLASQRPWLRMAWLFALALAAGVGSTGLTAFGQSGASSSQSGASPSLQQGGSGQSGASSTSAQQPAQPAPPQITAAEMQAFNTLQNQIDPDKQLQLVKGFLQQFPKSALLTSVLFYAAGDEEEKNDVPDAINYGEQSLKLQPNNLRSLILVAGLLPLPQALALQPGVPQKQQQLDQSEDDANRALQLISKLQPGPNFPAERLDQAKVILTAQLHSALGMAHLQKAVLVPKVPGNPDPTELTSAEQNFKSAVAVPQPSPQDYFRLGEVYIYENKPDDAISDFTQAAQLSKGTALEKLADQMIAKLQAGKAKNAPAAKPTQ